MKNKIVSLTLLALACATIQPASAADLGRKLYQSAAISGAGALTFTQSPLLVFDCLRGELKNEMGECTLGSYSVATSTTLLLLKEAQAAQPDALNYLAGAAPSPILYSIVEKIQEVSALEFEQELTFDEVVNGIVSKI